jgi:hypothetical protein
LTSTKAARSICHVNAHISIRSIATGQDGGRENHSSQAKAHPLDSKWIRPRQCIVDTVHPAHIVRLVTGARVKNSSVTDIE